MPSKFDELYERYLGRKTGQGTPLPRQTRQRVPSGSRPVYPAPTDTETIAPATPPPTTTAIPAPEPVTTPDTPAPAPTPVTAEAPPAGAEGFFDRIRSIPRFDYIRAANVTLGTQVAEEFRHLRTNIQTAHRTGVRVITVTSCHHAEGKTSTALNLARFLAKTPGARVLLMDCDLRRPQVKDRIAYRPERGLDDVLLGEAELADCVVRSEEDGLCIAPTRRGSNKAAELFETPRFDEVLALARHLFDHVIVDTPPLLSTTDPAVIGKRTDGVALVVQAGLTQRESILHVKGLLAQVGVEVLGVILTKVRDYLPRTKYLYRYHYYRDYYHYTDHENASDHRPPAASA